MRENTNKYLLYILKFFIFSLLFFVLFNAGINNLVFPFAIAMFYALAWANQKIWLLVPAYIIGGVCHSPTMEFSIVLLVNIFCLILPYIFHILAKKSFKKW